MKRFLLAIVLIVAMVVGGCYLCHHEGYKAGYKAGASEGFKAGYWWATPEASRCSE